MSVVLVPTVVGLGTLALAKGPLGLSAAVSCMISPAWLWLTVRWLEDGVACLKACVELSTLLASKGEVREERKGEKSGRGVLFCSMLA